MSSADIEFRMKTKIAKVHKVLIEVFIVRSFEIFLTVVQNSKFLNFT